jgi:hypothetical protein
MKNKVVLMLIVGISSSIFLSNCKNEEKKDVNWDELRISEYQFFHDEVSNKVKLQDLTMLEDIFNKINRNEAEYFEFPINTQSSSKKGENPLLNIRELAIPNEYGENEIKTDTSYYKIDDVIGLVFLESIQYQPNKIEKETVFWGPLVKTYDKEGNERGKKILFLIKN